MIRSGVCVASDFELDVINLCDGRDFLQENLTYDLVILGLIFAGTHNIQKVVQARAQYEDGSTIVSPFQSLVNWKNRLASTHAKIIVSIGCTDSEITVNLLNDSSQFVVSIAASTLAEAALAVSTNQPTSDWPYMSGFSLSTTYLESFSSFLLENADQFNTQLTQRVRAPHILHTQQTFSNLQRNSFLASRREPSSQVEEAQLTNIEGLAK